MSYRLEISSKAEKDIERLPDPVVKRIDRRFTSISADPYAGARKLSSDPAFRARVGDYRIIYDIDDPNRTVNILSVRHRKDVYRRS